MTLHEKVLQLPLKPGVYIYKNYKGEIIYVGKAKSLKDRVRSYFQDSKYLDAKTQSLVKNICDLDYIVTDSEVEALVLECNLIKEHKPHYNILLKDDKAYPYIKITLDEDFPRVIVTRKLKKDKGKYFGPYTNIIPMRHIIKLIYRIFPVRNCDRKISASDFDDNFDPTKLPPHKRACLSYHIGKCDAPCENRISKEKYGEMIDCVSALLSGKTAEVIERLKAKMFDMAEKLKFEEAAKIRDQISAIERLSEKQKISSPELIDRDYLAYAKDGNEACGVCLQIRTGKMLGKNEFFLKNLSNSNDEEIFSSFVKQYYQRVTYIPDEIVLQMELEDSEIIEKWLCEKKGRNVKLVVPQKGKKSQLIEMAIKNAFLLLEEKRIAKGKASQRVPDSVKELQRVLNLNNLPRRIEAFDISNIQGADAVASMVVFENGVAHKSEYRKFKIKTVEGVDDFKMMKEVINRRFSKLKENGEPFPDLILVDGGKGQLSSAVEVLESLNITNQQIIGLAKKNEEIFLPNQQEPIILARSSEALRLIQRIRNEAHRFAIQYHRNLRKLRTITSELDKIDGIGKVRRIELLRQFGSIDKIKSASIDELRAVKGITKKTAEMVYNYFHPPQQEILTTQNL